MERWGSHTEPEKKLRNDVPEMVDAFYQGDAISEEGDKHMSSGVVVKNNNLLVDCVRCKDKVALNYLWPQCTAASHPLCGYLLEESYGYTNI